MPLLGGTAMVTLAVALLLVAAVVGGERREDAHAAPGPPSTTSDRAPSRPAINGSSRPALPAAAQRAVERLAVTSRRVDGPGHDHTGTGGHLFGPAEEVALTPAEEDRFAVQWSQASARVSALDTPAEAAAAGYVLSSTRAPGVGVHWVNWELIGQPFDPARPSMLLFSSMRGVDRLVGFSYWVQASGPPDGFAGPNDHWHTHAGLCVVNGWVEREGVARPAECPGSWLAGDDLWMLHAWVVAGVPNRWGRFAPANPMPCPSGPVPDLASCHPDTG